MPRARTSPGALRDAALVEALLGAGVQVPDVGDLTEQIRARLRAALRRSPFRHEHPGHDDRGGTGLDGPGSSTASRSGSRTGRVANGTDPTRATDFEREQVAALGISITTQDDLIADPAAAAATALRALPDAPFAAHVDVDVLDFTDAPLAENTSGPHIGPALNQLGAALNVVIADPRWRALSIGELNPTRSSGDPQALTRCGASLTDALAHASKS